MRKILGLLDSLGALAIYAVLALFVVAGAVLAVRLAAVAGWYAPLLLVLLVPLALGIRAFRHGADGF